MAGYQTPPNSGYTKNTGTYKPSTPGSGKAKTGGATQATTGTKPGGAPKIKNEATQAAQGTVPRPPRQLYGGKIPGQPLPQTPMNPGIIGGAGAHMPSYTGGPIGPLISVTTPGGQVIQVPATTQNPAGYTTPDQNFNQQSAAAEVGFLQNSLPTSSQNQTFDLGGGATGFVPATELTPIAPEPTGGYTGGADNGAGGGPGVKPQQPIQPEIPPMPPSNADLASKLLALAKQQGRILKVTPMLQQILMSMGTQMRDAFLSILKALGFQGNGVIGDYGAESDFLIPPGFHLTPDGMNLIAQLPPEQQIVMQMFFQQVLGEAPPPPPTAPMTTPPAPVAPPTPAPMPQPAPTPA